MVLLKLALNQFRSRKARTILTIAAVALSVSLVVAVTTGYRSFITMAHQFQDRYLGSTDAQVTKRDETRTEVPASLIDDLRADPRVLRAAGRLESESQVLDAPATTEAATAPASQPATDLHQHLFPRAAHLIGVQPGVDERIRQLPLKEGRWFNPGETNVAVIDTALAEQHKAKLGDTLYLPTLTSKLPIRIVGIVQKPGIMAGFMRTMYLPLPTLQKFTAPEGPPSVTRIMIDTRPGTDLLAFEKDWSARLQAIDPTLHIRLTRESRKQLDDQLQGMHLMSMLGGAVTMLAATFIVFSSLSMGVIERQRTLAMMRAIGAFKSQIALLVIIEGLLVGGIGAAVGVPLGYSWIRLLAWKFPHFFTAGVHLDPGGTAFAVGGSVLAALAASFLPAWSATRVTPLEAMTPLSQARVGFPFRATIFGLLLVAVDPIVLYGPWPRGIAFLAHFVLGMPALMVGFFLLAPAVVIVVERTLGPILAWLLGLRFALLRQQLSGGLWRAAGTCAALMVGLAVLVVLQTQGRSMLGGWKLPDKFPDVFIYRLAGPMRVSDAKIIEQVPGVKKGEVMPVAVVSPEFAVNIFGFDTSSISALAGAELVPNATMLFGIDPHKAFKMIELDFRVGSAAQAEHAMETKPRQVIVTEEFHQLKGLTVGDKIPLRTTKHGTVDYTICGVVWSPGIDVMLGVADPGKQFEQRTFASLFGTLDDLKEDFGVDSALLFAANLDYFVDKTKLMKQINKDLGTKGMEAGDVRQIKAAMQSFFTNLLNLASSVAFAAMAVSSLGVTNTVMASIRSRRWQFGVLRAIGVTRGQLLRLVLAEAILIGIVGCALGLAAGALMTFDARQLYFILLGLISKLVVPYAAVAIGAGAVMVVALAASIGPALGVARTQPLTLLQAGRASA